MSNPRKKPIPQTIGIMGAGNGCGVTHFAVLLANYLAAVEQKRTALFEWNRRNDLEKLVNIYTGSHQVKIPFSLFAVDYFFCGSQEEFNRCIQSGYDVILLDLGTVKEGKQTEFLQCQRQCFLLALNEWKLGDVTIQKEFRRQAGGKWDFLMVFGSDEARREIRRRYGLNVMQIPFAQDAFSIHWEMAEFLGRVWNEKDKDYQKMHNF